MTYVTANSNFRRASGFRPGLGFSLLRISQTLKMWYDRSQERRHLAALDDHLLRDIGINRANACKEASKPFWR